MMRCQQLFALLSEFIDGQLSEDVCREMHDHLADCVPCQAFSRTLRKTVDICRTLPSEPLPEEMRRELKQLFQAELADLKQKPAP